MKQKEKLVLLLLNGRRHATPFQAKRPHRIYCLYAADRLCMNGSLPPDDYSRLDRIFVIFVVTDDVCLCRTLWRLIAAAVQLKTIITTNSVFCVFKPNRITSSVEQILVSNFRIAQNWLKTIATDLSGSESDTVCSVRALTFYVNAQRWNERELSKKRHKNHHIAHCVRHSHRTAHRSRFGCSHAVARIVASVRLI